MNFARYEECPYLCESEPMDRTKRTKTRPLTSTDIGLFKERCHMLIVTSCNLMKFEIAIVSKMTKSFDNTTGLEQEYIKSLQQQVYLLELENNHLRQQATKATEMHPRMTAEAENMLARLKDLQTKIDTQELELYRKESNIDSLNSNIKHLTERMSEETSNHTREKKMLMDEVVQMKRDKDALERECSKRQMQINEVKDDHNRNLVSLKAAETKVAALRGQLESQMDQTKVTELALADKRSELMQMEAKLREAEDKYFNNTARLADQAKQELREEVRVLRQKLKEAEMNAENDRFLRTKLSDDSSQLVRENAVLNQSIVELRNQLEKEKDLRETFDSKRSSEIMEISRLRERQKELGFENKRLREEMVQEKKRNERLSSQTAKHETLLNTQQLDNNLTQKRLSEAEFTERKLGDDNAKLKKDKEYLIEHVDSLERQVKEKDSSVRSLHKQIDLLESRLQELEQMKTLEENLQSKRWTELERMAETLKSHARSMASTSGDFGTQTRTGRLPEPEY